MPTHPLADSFGRSHDYLRISLTDACNLRCQYCMPEEHIRATANKYLMQPAEILAIAKTFVEMGITKIRLTGGEPLLRKEATEIMQQLSGLPVRLSISTNAVLADRFIPVFKASGIKDINVSLDTLDPAAFEAITKRGDFHRIRNNIQLLLEQGFRVKVNMVVMKGVNENSIPDFIAWTKHFPLEVRFIEFMPFAGNSWNRESVLGYREMLAEIAKIYPVQKLEDKPHDTAKRYAIPGHTGSFAFITTVTEPFCSSCNRLRLTADGKMKNCLFSEGESDLLSAFRKGEDIRPLIAANILTKKRERGGRFDFEHIPNRSMIRIGG
jgi:cyclic pyranopterin phosphate synthase